MKIFNKIKIAFLGIILLSGSITLAQTGGPAVDFNVEPNATAEMSSGGNVNITLTGSLALSGGATIDDAVLFVAYSTSPIDPGYTGSFQQAYWGSSDPFASDFDSSNAFVDIIGGFNPGTTYYFLFKTGLDPVPSGFIPDLRIVNVTTPAAPSPGDDDTPGAIDPDGDGNMLGGFNLTTHIVNPLGTDFEFIDFLRKLFANMVKIAIPFLVLFIIYSGLLFVEAQGNEEKLKQAKKNFTYVIIGATLVLGAWMIANALKGTVEQIENDDTSYIENFINRV